MVFLSTYRLGEQEFSNQFFSRSWEEASLFCRTSIDEKVVGCLDEFSLFSDLIFEDLTSDELLHLVCFASWLNLKSGYCSIDDILSDCGVLHELIHYRSDEINISPVSELRHKVKTLVQLAFNYQCSQNVEHLKHKPHEMNNLLTKLLLFFRWMLRKSISIHLFCLDRLSKYLLP
jgi:hypothetical protein